jgi:hypothetical protein
LIVGFFIQIYIFTLLDDRCCDEVAAFSSRKSSNGEPQTYITSLPQHDQQVNAMCTNVIKIFNSLSCSWSVGWLVDHLIG